MGDRCSLWLVCHTADRDRIDEVIGGGYGANVEQTNLNGTNLLGVSLVQGSVAASGGEVGVTVGWVKGRGLVGGKTPLKLGHKGTKLCAVKSCT